MDYNKYFSSISKRLSPSLLRSMSKYLHIPEVISFAGAAPTPDTFPLDTLMTLAQRVKEKYAPDSFQYGPTCGVGLLRESIAKYLVSERGFKAQASGQIVITSGSQQALHLLGLLFVEEEDKIAVELPSYTGGLAAMAKLGGSLVGVAMDQEGLIPEDLERLCQKDNFKLLYTIPNFQNPTGICLSLKRRRQVLELASKYDFLIIEDDPYGELYYQGVSREIIQPIYALEAENQRVIYLSSFSKTILPGFRQAYLVAPNSVVTQLNLLKESSDLCGGIFDQYWLHEFLVEEDYPKHLQYLRQFYSAKARVMEDALRRIFTSVEISPLRGGMFFFFDLDTNLDLTRYLSQCIQEFKVAFMPGSVFYANQGGLGTVRVCFSNESDENLVLGVERLGKFFRKLKVI